ncbi:uncharacterized protein RHO25_012141 [Cercospora beticola]|uniref:Uncharacterized protein n=1 Tax=Cercospora beticola TaxID=122368 RepID=A0ABZ0P6R9_CERBT|nr:hypothetical protein RHO25_012141 [Cercospora beticola]
MKTIALLASAALAFAAPLPAAMTPPAADLPAQRGETPQQNDSKGLGEKDIEIIVAVLLAFFFPLGLFWIRRRLLPKSPDDAAHAANIGEEKGVGDARRIPAVAGAVGGTGGVDAGN